MAAHRHTVAVPTLEDPHDTPPSEPDPFEGLVLDEDFVRGATAKESSARARMLASKWRQEPPGDTSWRPEPSTRRGWYQRRPKDRAVGGVPRRRRLAGRWQAPLFVLLAVGLVLVATNPAGVKDWFTRNFGSTAASARPQAGIPAVAAPSATPTPEAPETAPPTSAPSAAPGTPTVAEPFAGSPALDWPQGASAIVVPQAHAVGYYPSSDVASYLQHAKQFLVDSNLDPSVLAGGYPTAALGLLDPQDTQLLSPLKQELGSAKADTAKHDSTDFFTRFNPQQARLDGSVVKVQGELTYKGDGHGGLLIHADYTFVYPLVPGPHPEPASASSAGDTDVARVIVRRIIDFDIPDGDGYVHTPGTLWPTSWTPEISNTDCGVANGYVNPAFPGEAPVGTQPSGKAVDPYDRSKLPTPGACGRVTRT